MDTSNLFTKAYLTSIVLIVFGTTLKFMHLPGTMLLFFATGIATAIYIVAALIEIYGASKLTTNEKIMWTICFLFGNFITGLVYLILGRPRILREFKILTSMNNN